MHIKLAIFLDYSVQVQKHVPMDIIFVFICSFPPFPWLTDIAYALYSVYRYPQIDAVCSDSRLRKMCMREL